VQKAWGHTAGRRPIFTPLVCHSHRMRIGGCLLPPHLTPAHRKDGMKFISLSGGFVGHVRAPESGHHWAHSTVHSLRPLLQVAWGYRVGSDPTRDTGVPVASSFRRAICLHPQLAKARCCVRHECPCVGHLSPKCLSEGKQSAGAQGSHTPIQRTYILGIPGLVAGRPLGQEDDVGQEDAEEQQGTHYPPCQPPVEVGPSPCHPLNVVTEPA
jgi:hypothetical protein